MDLAALTAVVSEMHRVCSCQAPRTIDTGPVRSWFSGEEQGKIARIRDKYTTAGCDQTTTSYAKRHHGHNNVFIKEVKQRPRLCGLTIDKPTLYNLAHLPFVPL